MSILQVEWLKLKRTPLKWLVFLTPLLYAGALVWYVAGRTYLDNFQLFVFQAFFEVWAAVIIPVGSALLAGLMVNQEALAGNFQGLLATRRSRKVILLGKTTILVILTSISTALALLGLILGLRYLAHFSVPVPTFILAALIAELTTIPLLLWHLWVGLAWGMGPTIGIGAGGLLLGALMGTGLGDGYWQYLPWGWPIRLTLAPGLYLQDRAATRSASGQMLSDLFRQHLLKGTVPALIFLILVVIGSFLWFDRWEGRNKPD